MIDTDDVIILSINIHYRKVSIGWWWSRGKPFGIGVSDRKEHFLDIIVPVTATLQQRVHMSI